jgi:hypothetical protein
MEIEKVIYKLSKEDYENYIIPLNLFNVMKTEKQIILGKQYPRLKQTDKRGKLAFYELTKKIKLNHKIFNIFKKEEYEFNDDIFEIYLKKENKELDEFLIYDLNKKVIYKKKELSVDEKLNDLIDKLSNKELLNLNIKINHLIIKNIQSKV